MDMVAVVNDLRQHTLRRLREHLKDGRGEAGYLEGRLSAFEEVLRLAGQEEAIRREHEMEERAHTLAALAQAQHPYELVCTRCSATIGSETEFDAGYDAAEDGWRVVNGYPYCEDCAPKKEEE